MKFFWDILCSTYKYCTIQVGKAVEEKIKSGRLLMLNFLGNFMLVESTVDQKIANVF